MSKDPALAWNAEVGAVKVRFGAGRLGEVGEVARALGGCLAVLVTDG